MYSTFAIFSKVANVTRVHYSHLSQDVAEAEVERLNSHCSRYGQPAVYWCEDHHPEAVYVIS